MINNEYEYSFTVSNIDVFINYCENNNYILKHNYSQIRTLYKGSENIMARITKNIYDDKTIEILNFKDDNLNDNILKINRETADLIITEKNRDFVLSLIEFLNLKEAKVLHRKRYVYQKNNVIFEIDDYSIPLMKVVAIEGVKEEVDIVYDEIKAIINKYQEKN